MEISRFLTPKWEGSGMPAARQLEWVEGVCVNFFGCAWSVALLEAFSASAMSSALGKPPLAGSLTVKFTGFKTVPVSSCYASF